MGFLHDYARHHAEVSTRRGKLAGRAKKVTQVARRRRNGKMTVKTRAENTGTVRKQEWGGQEETARENPIRGCGNGDALARARA